ncbi:MAG TPA: heparin lyase I family protein [Chthonomonadales bacterium]|nr:heparin lyase I family protein [Chthonomonadales bacterium]
MRTRRGAPGALFVSGAALILSAAGAPAGPDAAPAPPRNVTAETRANPAALRALEAPGRMLWEDGFESRESLARYFEIRGLNEGHATLDFGPGVARGGRGAFRFTAPARDGRESSAGAVGWLGREGHDRVHFRRYIRFAPDYDQGHLHHVGGGLAAVAGANRYRAMGSAGIRPRGDDHFNSRLEPWRDWGRYPPPGYLFLYTYWMDMVRDRDGRYWGNMLGPPEEERAPLQRGRWYCLEHMIRANDPGQANGELAAWLDGRLILHFTGIRWRTSADVRIKRFEFGIYVHRATRDNTVWYDDVALSTGYIGPAR